MLLHDLRKRLREWRRTRHAISRLNALDDRLLDDLGVARDEIAQSVRSGRCR
jgi:uncharacterized protein YjiS (DUF1127 family)